MRTPRSATEPDRARLKAAFDTLQDCYARVDEVTRAEEGAADARFHLACRGQP